ncbi:MAG: alpha/beta hydrolase [Solobacterium sp.]|nr:alpha/beta hydrolase [Solobacterium sp.]
MFINEYGNRSDPTVILLAPMMISGSDLYEQMCPYLQGTYHIIAPDQGGHGKAGAYISADEEYQTLKNFLLETGCTTIDLIYGASMGVAVGYRLFMDPDFTVRHAWFDGAALKDSAGFAEWFVSRMFRIRKKLSARLQCRPSSALVKMYGREFAGLMAKNFERITPRDIDAICHACCHYELRRLTEEEQSRLHLDFGEKDFDLKISGKTIPVYMPDAAVVIRTGYAHCGYMAAHPKEYVEEIEQFIGRRV